MHMTGRYPDWWEGAEFKRPGRFWVAGVTGESTRDNPQRILIGSPELRAEYGSGCIPRDALVTYTLARGTPNLMDSFVVLFGGGGDTQQGKSMVLLKGYEKGREKWQGDTVDCVWFDEEPPADIYSEGKTRTNKGQRGPFVFTTFTPLNGMSEVVRGFLTDDQVKKERMH